MCCLTGIMFDGNMMTVAYQNAYSIRRKGNTVFLERHFFGNSNMQLGAFGLDVKCFLKGFVVECSTYYRLWVRHTRANTSIWLQITILCDRKVRECGCM